ncbi:MAG: GldG family protein [Treponema sp.]|jgi:ABC-type uncharacterized transport system involved in gliding motility auxiliary subunit|nr:GldG family protein [Treponema sp.]
MTKKQLALITGLTLTALILGLLISRRLWFRLDLTKNQAYTISQVSRNLYTEIPDQVHLIYYLSDKLSALYPQPREILDLLREYAAYSRGKIRVTVRDPVKAGLADTAERLGIRPIEINTTEQDQSTITRVYTGIVIEYLDNAEVLPIVTSVETLEYDLTGRIRSLVQETKREIGVIVGDSVKQWDKDYRNLNQMLAQSGYAVRVISPGDEIGDALPALFVFGGTEDLDEWSLYRIDRYIQGGGKVLFAVDTVTVNSQDITVKMDKGLISMISLYGATVKPALVLDQSAHILQPQMTRYPHWVNVLGTSGNKDNPLTLHFSGLDLFWPNPIELNPPESVDAQPLFTSTGEAWLMTKDFTINPDASAYLFELEAADTKGTAILGAVLTGTFPSYFGGLPKPLREGSVEELPDLPTVPKGSRIIVIGNTEFAAYSYEYMTQYTLQYALQYNSTVLRDLDFLVLAADWLSNDDDIVSIRNRQGQRQLDKILDQKKRIQAMVFARVFNVVVVPLAVIAAGIGIAWKRKSRAEKAAVIYRKIEK